MLHNFFTKQKQLLFDAQYCLRAYPEFRESIITSITHREWSAKSRYIEKELRILYNSKYPFSERLRRAFERQYPGVACIDPSFDATHYASINNLTFTTFEEAYTHWLTVGKQQGLEYAPGKNTTLTVVLKTYNESFFLDEWLDYYEATIGLENVIILDHTSTDERVLRTYRKREKELLIIRVPRHIEHDTLHNTRHFRILFDLIKAHCLFFTLLDTDEFLCRWNGTQLTSEGITERLQTLKHEQALGTVWLTNYFDGTEADTPSGITTFNLQDQPLRHNVKTSKNIFRYDNVQEVIGHNKTVPGIAITPDVFVLHVKRGNFTARIDAQLRACISFNLIDAHDDTQTIIQKLERTEPKLRRHCAKEVLGYLTDSQAYVRNMIDDNAEYRITTDVIKATIKAVPSTTTFAHPTHTTCHELITEHFAAVVYEMAPGAHIAQL